MDFVVRLSFLSFRMQRILISILLSLPILTFGQVMPDTVGFFDKHWKKTPRVSAIYFRTVLKVPEGYQVRDSYMSGALQMEALCSAYEPKLEWEGNTVLYYENGAKREEGPFKNEDRYGIHRFWFDDGAELMVVEYRGKEMIYHQVWSKNGTALLVNGTGVFQPESEQFKVSAIVEDSIVIASYQVKPPNDTLYFHTPNEPEYPDGPERMVRDLRSQIRYPKSARRAGQEGRVFVSFVVDKSGALRDAWITKGIGKECDAEALRVVRSLHAWQPGTFHSKPVNCVMTLPINFKLN